MANNYEVKDESVLARLALNGVLLRSLPYAQPQRLVMVWASRAQLQEFPLSPADFVDLRDQNQVFEQIAAFYSRPLTINGYGEPQVLGGVRASANLFALLGIKARQGRTFLPDEDQWL